MYALARVQIFSNWYSIYSMPSTYATSSYSMSRQLHRRLRDALPRHGDRSKLVARLIEMWLDKEIIAHNVTFRSHVVTANTNDSNVALNNT